MLMHQFIYQAYHSANYFYVITVKSTVNLKMDLKMVVVVFVVVEEGIVGIIFALRRVCIAVVKCVVMEMIQVCYNILFHR